MTAESGAATGEAPGAEKKDLDEVLLAMDVVDTLRHRERLVARELDAEAREAELIERLRAIYAAQGIEVPDRILRDGVKALEENRFAYAPPQDGLGVRLAKLYVARDRWWKPATGAVVGLAALAGGYQFGVAAPRAAAERAAIVELSETLPAELAALRARAQAIAEEDAARVRAEALYQDGTAAAAEGDRDAARAALSDLETLEGTLRADYVVRVVSRPGEYSGIFRIPDDAPDARNHYLIVEAVDANGRVLSVPITSEEDQTTAVVSIWGVRVPQAVFERVAADKQDDQIIQDAIIGRKARGRLAPTWSVSGVGGAIREW